MLIASIASCLLTSCATETITIPPITETIYLTPTKIDRPPKPKIELYDTKYGLDHPYNFRTFQRNAVITTDYIISLEHLLLYYETEIDRIKQLQDPTN